MSAPQSRATDELGRRIGRAEFLVFVLQRGEPREQLVEIAVGDDGRVLDVVAELVAADLVGKLLPLAPDVRRGSQARRIGVVALTVYDFPQHRLNRRQLDRRQAAAAGFKNREGVL